MPRSYSVLQVVPLPSISVVSDLNNVGKENTPACGYQTLGGILHNTNFAWLSCGPWFTVFNLKSGARLAAWKFGSVNKDSSINVVCVDELYRTGGKLPLLIVGLESDLTGGIICIFDIAGSKVIRAINIAQKVSSLHVINASYDKCPIPGPLHVFDGILAVGTSGGEVLLLDVYRQIYDDAPSGLNFRDIRDEINPCTTKTILLSDVCCLELHKQSAIKSFDHLSIHLNASSANLHFTLKGPNGDDRIHVNKEEVKVSCLHYCPQLGSLLVGYNFGAWQLWNLIDMQLVYTSPVYEENIPISHFAVQEPCDDPKAFCYVWVVYSTTESYQVNFPVAVLYSLNFITKEWHEGYGILYQGLNSCAVRFQRDLTFLDGRENDNVQQGAQCLRLQTINKNMCKGSYLLEHQEDTLSLCCVVWRGWRNLRSKIVTETYMSLFDLNQWYKEQMPGSLPAKGFETYITHVCLTNLLHLDGKDPDPFLDVRIDVDTLTQFIGSQKLEEHYYPSSLAFQFCGLRKADIIFFNNQGSQRALLSYLESNGPLTLLQPEKIFKEAIELGLDPLFVDIPSTMTIEYKREVLLSIGLEQQLIGWLCKCASVWSTGIHSAEGCNLQFLLDWGWERAHELKENADRLSIPLFDYSGIKLDANTRSLLSNAARQLKYLTTLFGYILYKFSRFILDLETTKQQNRSLQMVYVHLEVLQWLLNVGLLPESPLSSYPRTDEFNRISAPYPVDELVEYYHQRRTELQLTNKQEYSVGNSLLFIDNLIKIECGGYKVQKQWEIDGGTGLYPPPSLQALLRTYLVEDVDIYVKHCIVVYVFLDLAMTLDQNRYKPVITHLIKFPAVFQMSPSIIKITQAFWQLDHGDFTTAMEQLLDPLVSADDLKIWHHRIALKALLAQDQHSFALLYLQVRKPSVMEVQDLCTIISLYVANNMLDDALHYQRQNRSYDNEEKLLHHFYKECDKIGSISSILQFTLNSAEERAFMKYLEEVNHPRKHVLQTFYYVQQSQNIDSFNWNEKLNYYLPSEKGLNGKANADFYDLVMREYYKSLPKINSASVDFCKRGKPNIWKQVERPESFSVFVHGATGNIKYKSNIIQDALSKTKENWTHPVLNDHSVNETTSLLNTPRSESFKSCMTTPLIFPKISTLEDDFGPSPSKKLRLSPRLRLGTPEKTNTSSSNVRLDTPIIKRKLARSSASVLSNEMFAVGTPQSILKVSSLLHKAQQVLDLDVPDKDIENDNSADAETATTSNRLSLGKSTFELTARKSLLSVKPAVRFDISRTPSESSVTSNTSGPDFEIIEEQALIHSSMEDLGSFTSSNSKNSSLSPNTFSSSKVDSKSQAELQNDLENSQELENKLLNSSRSRRSYRCSSNIELQNGIDDIQELESELVNSVRSRRSYRHSSNIGSNLQSKSEDSQELENKLATLDQKLELQIDPSKSMSTSCIEKLISESTNELALTDKKEKIIDIPKTPRSRKSYKNCLPEIPIRSSPRLKKSLTEQKETPSVSNTTANINITHADSNILSILESSYKPSITSRRSLARQVLENNAFSKTSSTSLINQELSTSDTNTAITETFTITNEECKGSTLTEKNKMSENMPTQVDNSEISSFESSYDSLNVAYISISGVDSKNSSDIKISETENMEPITDESNAAYISISDAGSENNTDIKNSQSGNMEPSVNINDISISVTNFENGKNTKTPDGEGMELIVNTTDKYNVANIETKVEDYKGIEEEIRMDEDMDSDIIENNIVINCANVFADLNNKLSLTDPYLSSSEITKEDLNKAVFIETNSDSLEKMTNNDELDLYEAESLSNLEIEQSEVNVCEMNIQSSNISEEENDKSNKVDLIEISSSSDDNKNQYLQESDGSPNTEDTSSEDFDEDVDIIFKSESSHIFFKQTYAVQTDDDSSVSETDESSSDIQLEIIQEENEDVDDENTNDDKDCKVTETIIQPPCSDTIEECRLESIPEESNEISITTEQSTCNFTSGSKHLKRDKSSTKIIKQTSRLDNVEDIFSHTDILDESKETSKILKRVPTDILDKTELCESIPEESNEISITIEQNTCSSISGSKHLKSDKSSTATIEQTSRSDNVKDIFSHTDILDDDKDTSKILNRVPTDILDKTELCESIPEESNEISITIEKNTCISISGSKHLKSDKSSTKTIKQTSRKDNVEDIFTHTDILDEGKGTSKILNRVPTDILDKTKLCESIPEESNEISITIEQSTCNLISGSKHLKSEKSSTTTIKQTTRSDNVEDIFTHTDILDEGKETSKILNLVPTDILDKTELCESIENSNYLASIDVLHNTMENSKLTNETLKETLKDKDINQTDALDITEANQSLIKNKIKCFEYRGNPLVSNQTDILELTDATEEKSIFRNLDIMDKSEFCLGSDSISCDTTKMEEQELKKTLTAARRSRRSSSLQPTTTVYAPLRRSTRRNSAQSTPEGKEVAFENLTVTQLKNTDQMDNHTDLKTASPVTPSKRKYDFNSKTVLLRKRTLRSSSIDAETPSSPATRTRRALSVDGDKGNITKGHKQLQKNVQLPVIDEIPNSDKINSIKSQKSTTIKSSPSGHKTQLKHPKRAKSCTVGVDKNNLEEYSATRRLTRRQADLLRKTLNSSEINLSQHTENQEQYSDSDSEPLDEERKPNVKEIDPIKLLDRPTFEGKLDLEEQRNIQQSPSSSVPESPIGSARKLRSHSSMSNITSVSDESYIENKKRKSAKGAISNKTRRQLYKSIDLESKDGSLPPKSRRTGAGPTSDSGSDISQISKTQSLIETHSKPVKRTRSKSVQNDRPGVAKSPLRRSERRVLLQKSELPKIDEEGSDNKALKSKKDQNNVT